MRISLVTRIFSPEPGAASFRLSAVARSCAEKSHAVTVFTSSPPPGLQTVNELDEPGITVRRARVLRDSAGYVRGYLQYMSFDIPLALRLIASRRADVVLVEPPPTTGAVVRLVCALRRIPYAYYAADIWSDASQTAGAPGLVVTFVRWLERFAMRGAQLVLSVSDGVTQRLRELGVTANVRTVGNGSDLTAFSPEGPTQRMSAPYFIYTGTASEVHGARIFVDAFRKVRRDHPEAVLVYVGQGSDFPAITDSAESMADGAIHVLPRTSPAEIARWLRGATAALASVKPGVGYDFAFPTKMYAATSCGTPVIYAGMGPGRDFIDEVGYGIASDYDVDSVAAAMRDMLDTTITASDRDRAAAWARENVNITAVAARVRGALESIASSRTQRHQQKPI